MIATRSRTRLRRLALVAGLAILAGAPFAARRIPPTAATMRSVASACRRDYAAARTPGDSSVVDARVWVMEHGWRRIPACGELRRAGTL